MNPCVKYRSDDILHNVFQNCHDLLMTALMLLALVSGLSLPVEGGVFIEPLTSTSTVNFNKQTYSQL